MKLRYQVHVNDDESKALDYSRKRNAPITNAKSDKNCPYDNPDTLLVLQALGFDTSANFSNDFQQHHDQPQDHI